MFSLVSRKFLAMRNITLYSVCGPFQNSMYNFKSWIVNWQYFTINSYKIQTNRNSGWIRLNWNDDCPWNHFPHFLDCHLWLTEAYFLRSIIWYAKHEKVVGSIQVFFFCLDQATVGSIARRKNSGSSRWFFHL